MVDIEPVAPIVASTEQPVAIIASNLDRHAELVRVLTGQLNRDALVIDLASSPPGWSGEHLEGQGIATVIAIGEPALAAAVRAPNTDVIVAQVFDPPETYRHVKALPPFEMQLDYWVATNTQLQRIGVIGGAKVHRHMDALAAAARDRDLEVVSREVSSDKQMLLAFRAMVPYIDGFVFLPDESVLSPEIIRKVIAHGARNDTQILVYSPIMYQLGASLFICAVQADVAARIVELIEAPDVTSRPLSEMQVIDGRGEGFANVVR